MIILVVFTSALLVLQANGWIGAGKESVKPMVPSLVNVAASWKEEGSCIVLVPTGVREERFAVRGSHPSLLVVIDEGSHVIRKVWFEMAPSSRCKVFRDEG